MKLASFAIGGRASWGLVKAASVIDLGGVSGDRLTDLKAVIAANGYAELEASAAKADEIAIGQIEWLPLIAQPGKILCVGHNYETHRLETGRAKVGNPSIFTRFADTLTAHQAPIIRPAVSTSLDFEAELAVIIGKGGRAIAQADAMDHIAGLTCANDASVRDWQWHTQQFTPGKNFPNTCPLGPWMVTLDEMVEFEAVSVESRLNGQVMQRATLADLIFPLPVLIAYISTFTPLSPGDVILTGTPGGVGAKREPPIWMQPGDLIEVEISQVGLLSNRIQAEP